MTITLGKFLRWGTENLDAVESLGVMAGPTDLPGDALAKIESALAERCRHSLAAIKSAEDPADEKEADELLDRILHGLSVRPLHLGRKIVADREFVHGALGMLLRPYPQIDPDGVDPSEESTLGEAAAIPE